MPAAPLVWALADDRPGNVSQVLGIGEALGWPLQVKAIRYGAWARLPNALLGATVLGVSASCRTVLAPPWPDVVIGAGRRAAPVLRWLKRRHAQLFTVQVMWPGSARGLDLIAVPEHDEDVAGERVVRTLGAAHRVSPERLARAARDLESRVGHLPRPWIVCLIGGGSRQRPFTPDDARALTRRAAQLARERGGSLLVTTSRRTGPACEEAIEHEQMPVPVWLHRFGTRGENPYFGLLGNADAVVVTADSASMCTEACAVGVPVFLFQPSAGTSDKLARFQERLRARGYLQPLGAPWPERVPAPLYPQETVAAAIRARLCAARDAREMASNPPTR